MLPKVEQLYGGMSAMTLQVANHIKPIALPGERRLSRTVVFGAALVINTLSVRCVAQQKAIEHGGYIVLSAQAMVAFDLTGSDSLGEVAAREAPSAVVKAATAAAALHAFDADCTRYFAGKDGYVALLVWKCGKHDRPEDGEILEFFTDAGQRRLMPSSDGKPPDYDVLVPGRRPKEP